MSTEIRGDALREAVAPPLFLNFALTYGMVEIS